MFSAILGLATAGIGLASSLSGQSKAQQAADQQLQLGYARLQEARYQARLQAQQAFEQQQIMNRSLQFERDVAEGIMARNEANDRLALDFQNYAQRWQDRSLDFTISEQQRQVGRQDFLDAAAAAARQYDIGQVGLGNQVRRNERDFAISAFENALGIAGRERQQDIQQLRNAQTQVALERRFSEDLIRRAQGVLSQERQQEAALRNSIATAGGNLADKINATNASFGDFIPGARLGLDALRREEAIRAATQMDDVRRAADIVASKGEAGLIRRGVDQSTAGDQMRSQITRRIVDEFAKARTRARDEALGFISGANATFGQNEARDLTARRTLLGLAGQGDSALLSALASIRPLPSAVGPTQGPATGAYDRRLVSGNAGPPVAIGSSFYDRNVGGGVGQTIGVTNPGAVSFAPVSGINTAFASPRTTVPDAFKSSAALLTSGGSNLRASYPSDALTASLLKNAQVGATGVGRSLGSFSTQFGSALDRLFPNAFRETTPTPAPYVEYSQGHDYLNNIFG
jgi:hypothetical protein